MSRELTDLDPLMQPVASEFLRLAWAAGLPVILTQTRRTAEEQDALYAQGRTAPGKIVTNARACDSAHCAGLAFDAAFRLPPPSLSPSPAAGGGKGGGVTWDEPKAGAWDQLGAIGISLGLTWGGHFTSIKDRPHFEMPGWRKLAQGAERKALGA